MGASKGNGVTVLVTGATGGIGEALALRAAREGARVFAAGRDAARLARLVGSLAAAGARAHALELDLEEPEPGARARELLAAQGGDPDALDCLFNVAGIAISAPLFSADAGARFFGRHMTVNFHGPRALIEAFGPGMKARGAGAIVNVASSAGLRGYAYTAAYCASKHALVGYTRAAARELAASGVTVAAVCPHYVDSPLLDAAVRRIVAKTGVTPDAAREFLAAENPGGRLVSCDEVADAAWSLARGGENGTILELDGAHRIRVEGPLARGARVTK